jgi:L-asparaginase
MTDPRAVRIVVTGGTLDKVHDTATEGLGFAPDGLTHLPSILTQARVQFPAVETVLMKDSLLFDDADRAAILAAARAAPEPALVITHGTGTMGRTARFLNGQIPGKTIVLTGAMRPHSLGRSDASFNLGGAVIAAQTLPHGVWGVMNGRVFAAADLDKNTATGRFDS